MGPCPCPLTHDPLTPEMNLAELQRLLRDANPAAVLVAPRILERVVRDDLHLPPMHWGLPHGKSYVCGRHLLFRHAEQADLEIEPDRVLPDTVILLQRPEAEELSNLERPKVLLKYWRRLFHSLVHLHLTAKREGGPLTDAQVRERVDELGLTEFEEVRQVLIQDRFLASNAGPRETYIEFAAVYLELRYFARSLLENYFPGIKDFAKVDQLIGRDLDIKGLFKQSRLTNAPDPAIESQMQTDDSQEAYWSLVRQAQGAALENNGVKAAILRMKASRIAPGARTVPTRQEAEGDIRNLTERLARAINLTDAERDAWARALIVLLDKADQGVWPVEARLLDDIQRVCEDSEREIYTLDVFDYLTSLGKRPIKRALPSQRLVRVVRHLSSAHGRLDEVRVADNDRAALGTLLKKAKIAARNNLDSRFRPVLETALDDVGLGARNPVEQVAFDKMVHELLDRIATHGFLGFGELRDAISRNQLKMPDTSDPESLWRGDPLIRLDTRLTSLLDGVYRPSDFYVRWLERGTALLFGTPPGRVLTRFVLLPLLAAWVLLHVLGLLLDWAAPSAKYPAAGWAAHVMLGPLHKDKPPEGASRESEAAHHDEHPPPHWCWHWGVLAGVGLVALGIFESRAFRRQLLRALIVFWRGLRWITWDAPIGMVPVDAIQRTLNSWLFQSVFWVLFIPGIVCAAVIWLRPDLFTNWAFGVGLWAVVAFLVNSRYAREISEAARDVAGQLTTLVRAGLIPGLVRLILQAFKQISDGIEGLLHAVDEWLRFRAGESPAGIVLRVVLSVLWFPIAFLVRFLYVVLIEPGINPLKLPISILAGKVLVPVIPTLYGALTGSMSPVLGEWLAAGLVTALLFLMPDAFGFLGWEMQENWRLYRANRPATLGPQPVGSHGETVRGLLQPGFHSGTIPHLYARLRVAERLALQSRNWNKVRLYRHELNEVGEALKNFLERELVALLKESRAWDGVPLEAGEVFLATNRVRFEILHAGHEGAPVQVEIQHHQGWLVAGLRDHGWLAKITPEQLDVFIISLAGFYKQADVDLVREQLQARLALDTVGMEVTADELVVRPAPGAEPVRYSLRDTLGFPNEDGPLRGKVFAWAPIAWEDWVGGWQADKDTGAHPGLPGVGPSLVNLSNPKAHYVSQMNIMIDTPPGLGLHVSEGQQG